MFLNIQIFLAIVNTLCMTIFWFYCSVYVDFCIIAETVSEIFVGGGKPILASKQFFTILLGNITYMRLHCFICGLHDSHFFLLLTLVVLWIILVTLNAFGDLEIFISIFKGMYMYLFCTFVRYVCVGLYIT